MTKLICSVDGCGKLARGGRGWCKPHYDAWYRDGDPLLYKGDRRITSNRSAWDKIQEIGWTRTERGCLEYNGFLNEHGYGQFRDKNEGFVYVHRQVYSSLIGPLAREERVLHRCDNPPCGEPSHLFKGTQADNCRDMYAKGRDARSKWVACPNGHPYPPERPRNVNKNRCRPCANERSRRYYERKKLNGLAQQPPTSTQSG